MVVIESRDRSVCVLVQVGGYCRKTCWRGSLSLLMSWQAISAKIRIVKHSIFFFNLIIFKIMASTTSSRGGAIKSECNIKVAVRIRPLINNELVQG